MPRTIGKTDLLKITDSLQKLLDQRAVLDEQITEMKKTLIAAIEGENAPAKIAPKPKAGRKPNNKKLKEPKTKEPKRRGRKPKTEQVEQV
jgi:hypothetical protein